MNQETLIEWHFACTFAFTIHVGIPKLKAKVAESLASGPVGRKFPVQKGSLVSFNSSLIGTIQIYVGAHGIAHGRHSPRPILDVTPYQHWRCDITHTNSPGHRARTCIMLSRVRSTADATLHISQLHTSHTWPRNPTRVGGATLLSDLYCSCFTSAAK